MKSQLKSQQKHQKTTQPQHHKTSKRSIATQKRKAVKKTPTQLQPLALQRRKFSQQPNSSPQTPDAVDFLEEPQDDAFGQGKGDGEFKEYKQQFDEDAPKVSNFMVKQDNPSSFHGPIYTAAPLKVNINNIFDPRADYKMDSGYYTMRFEVDHYGQNINEDLIEKSDWHDKHITNEWFDTMITRYCPHLSKKAKQMKPSNEMQSRKRKLHKQSNEKRLAKSIRDAIDNTPRFSVFSNSLAENKQIYGTYLPSEKDFREYKTSGKEMAAKLAVRGKEVDYKQSLLRRFRESRGDVDV